MRSINASTLVQGRRFVPPLLLAVAAAALVALLLSRRITRPVQELTEASERIARGDYDVHLTSKGPDELGQLALRFEQMARQLKEASEHERNFLMRISHELRTPLTAIQGHVQAIADGVIEGEEEQQASLEIVLAEAGRLQRLIGDLLDLARLETRRFSLNVEEVDLLDGLRERGRRAARGGARPRTSSCTSSAEAKPVVVGDGDRILQIVTNLVTNALHATPADGEVAVDVALADGVGRVVVSDTGPGIPEAERASILRPFVTSDVRHGIGLGLPGRLRARAGDGRHARGRRARRAAARRSRCACRWRPGAARAGPRRAGAARSRRPSSSPSRAGVRRSARTTVRTPAGPALLGLGVADLGDGLLQLVDERRRDRAADLVVDRRGDGDEQRRDGEHDADVLDGALPPFGVQDPRGERRVMKTDMGESSSVRPAAMAGGRCARGAACPARRARAPVGSPPVRRSRAHVRNASPMTLRPLGPGRK